MPEQAVAKKIKGKASQAGRLNTQMQGGYFNLKKKKCMVVTHQHSPIQTLKYNTKILQLKQNLNLRKSSDDKNNNI